MADSQITEIAVLQQGAQYYLPFKIKHDGEITSPQNVDDIKIKIGSLTKQLTKNELEYADGYWLFPIRQEFTLSLNADVKCQASILRGDNVYPSKTYEIHVDMSIIKDGF